MVDEREVRWASRTFAELRGHGMTRRDIAVALDTGLLVRARRDVYVSGAVPQTILRAARVGGRLDSVSLLRELGVFVLDRSAPDLHVQIPRHRSRLRLPSGDAGGTGRVIRHWRDDDVATGSLCAGLLPALAQAVLDQPPRAAVATLDSALNSGVLCAEQLGEVFALLPGRLWKLRGLVDGRAESGPETFVRLIARTLGVPVEPQVVVEGVGRADLVVDGRIIIECDSRAFHGGWAQQESDRRRDLGYAARGYATIRPTARQIFAAPGLVREALEGLLRGPRT